MCSKRQSQTRVRVRVFQVQPVPNLVNEDKIVVTVLYEEPNTPVKTTTYTWTLLIPTPELINALYNPGSGSPAFSSNQYDYMLTLPTGTTQTATTLSKQPGDLVARVQHRSSAAGGQLLPICDFGVCTFGPVSPRRQADWTRVRCKQPCDCAISHMIVHRLSSPMIPQL